MSSMCMWQGRLRRNALYGIYWWELQLPFDMILFTQDRISAFILCVYLSLLSITDQGVHSHGLIQSLSTSFSISISLLPGRILKCYFIFYRLLDPFYRIPLEGTNTISPRPPVFHKQTSRILCWGRQDVSSIYFPCSTCPPPLNVCKQEAAVKMLSGYGNRIFMDSKTYL